LIVQEPFDLSLGTILALDRLRDQPQESFAVYESFSAVFTQNISNPDIFPFDSIVPDRQICMKNTSFLRNYLDLIPL